MAGETSPNSTAGLDDFALGEGISPGGNEELLDSLVDIADDNSPRGPGLAPPHTVTSDAMDLGPPVLDPGARQHSLQDLDLDLTPKSPSKVQIVLDDDRVGIVVVLHVLLRNWVGDRLRNGLRDRFFVLRVLHRLLVGVGLG